MSGSKLITNDADDLDYENTSSLEIFVKVSDGVYSTVGKMTINLTDDRTEDADGDGLTEAQEEDTYGTSDTNVNSDGDGYTDAQEVAAGKDPADATDFLNEAPVILNQSFTISETTANSTEIGTLVATDSNNDSLTYSITSNLNADSDSNETFSISGSKLVLNDNGDINYESATTLQITIRTSDSALTDTATITINLTDDRTEDADGDGLTEAQEEDTYGTSDTNTDSDGDSFPDAKEITTYKTDPSKASSYPTANLKVINPSNGSVTANSSYKLNTIATLTATPETGYLFSAWTNAASGNNASLFLVMGSDKTIGATFTKDNADTDDDGFSNYDELVTYLSLIHI